MRDDGYWTRIAFVSEPAAVIFLFWMLTPTRGPATIFFRMKRSSLNIRAHKTAPKKS
jgi:hypothetical protein